MQKTNCTDMLVHSELTRSVASLAFRNEVMNKYLEVVEYLLGQNPKDKEVVMAVYESSLRCNKFDKAAKMAAKLVNNFQEPKFVLAQVQLLYMDSINGGNPMSLTFAIAFCEKYLAGL